MIASYKKEAQSHSAKDGLTMKNEMSRISSNNFSYRRIFSRRLFFSTVTAFFMTGALFFDQIVPSRAFVPVPAPHPHTVPSAIYKQIGGNGRCLHRRADRLAPPLAERTGTGGDHIPPAPPAPGGAPPVSFWDRAALALSGAESVASVSALDPDGGLLRYLQLLTLLRIGVPGLAMGALGAAVYPALVAAVTSSITNGPGDASQIAGTFDLILQDNSNQFIQNMHNAMSLLFSIFVVYTYFFMYRQQEQIFYSLFEEVTSAKSLLEQIGLVSTGRTGLHRDLLGCIRQYVDEDLRGIGGAEVSEDFRKYYGPASMLSRRPDGDPLERILYLTSVGVPSRSMYDTVRTLRTARARRLAASQRKVPELQMLLLYSLIPLVLVSFPVVGAGAQTVGGAGIIDIQGYQFGVLIFVISVALGMVNEMTNTEVPSAYSANVACDSIIKGLAEDLEGRSEGLKIYEEELSSPSTPN